ncbi:MAG: Gfo/Idh/MocA family protein [Lachnospiraceae bacterium]
MQEKKIKVGIVGISFGMEFVPIYQRHPNVESVAVADYNRSLLATCAEKFHIPAEDCYTNLDDMLKDTSIDAIHICTPPASHAELSIKALNAGRHCGCTIPMGMSIDELYEVIEARKKAERIICSWKRPFWQRILLCTELYKKGELGKLQVRPAPITGIWKAGRNTGKDFRR